MHLGRRYSLIAALPGATRRLLYGPTGPLYDPRTSTLHFVDIEQNKVWRPPSTVHVALMFDRDKLYHYHVLSEELTIEEFEEPITCLALRRDGKGVRDFGLVFSFRQR